MRKPVLVCPLGNEDFQMLRLIKPELAKAYGALKFIVNHGSELHRLRALMGLYAVHFLIKKIIKKHRMPTLEKDSRIFFNKFAEYSALLLDAIKYLFAENILQTKPYLLWALILGEGEYFESSDYDEKGNPIITKSNHVLSMQRQNKALLNYENCFSKYNTKILFNEMIFQAEHDDKFNKKYYKPLIRARQNLTTMIRNPKISIAFEMSGVAYYLPSNAKKTLTPLGNYLEKREVKK